MFKLPEGWQKAYKNIDKKLQKVGASKPAERLYTTRQIACYLAMSIKTVKRLTDAEIFQQVRPRLYSLIACTQAYSRYQRGLKKKYMARSTRKE